LAIGARIRKAWNAFNNQSQNQVDYSAGIPTYAGSSPSAPRRRFSNERTIIAAIYNRLAIDISGIPFHHVKLDDQKRYLEDMKTNFNNCLTLEANVDQAPRAFRQDIALTLFDGGCAAIVPVDTTVDPNTNDTIDIFSLRVGEICAWYPNHVRVRVYNEAKGIREDITLEKKFVAIVENPLYSVMNEPNSTLQRLIRKLSLLDAVDEQSSSGKLDLLIQLPYVIKSEARREQAEKRRADIEFQLKGSQYGIAYTDSTEKVTQLNRPAENNLLAQVEYLTNMLYSQLGLTEEIMNGTANEGVMINYYNRTVEPFLDAIIEAMQRSFIGFKGTENLESVRYFRNPFKLVPVQQLADIADKFTRNEIFSSNEIRGFMGVAPSQDPKADQLVNSNMPQPGVTVNTGTPDPAEQAAADKATQDGFDAIETTVDSLINNLGGAVNANP